jgi:hypothetical protein
MKVFVPNITNFVIIELSEMQFIGEIFTKKEVSKCVMLKTCKLISFVVWGRACALKHRFAKYVKPRFSFKKKHIAT